MAERVALVISALNAGELTAGRRDSTRVYTVLTDPERGACSRSSPSPVCDCTDLHCFSSHYQSVIRKLNPEDQLVFYFSGHGRVASDKFVLQVGQDENELVPFGNLISDFQVHGLRKAIFILDSCHSGAALREKGGSLVLDCISQIALPTGIAVLASCRDFEKSFETDDGAASVFTKLLCDAIESGLDGKPTPGSVITVDQVVEHINAKLNTPAFEQFAQTCQYEVLGAEGAIWLAKNVSGELAPTPFRSNAVQGITSEFELKVAYERILTSRHPCHGATLDDLDWELVRTFAQEETGEELPMTKEAAVSKLKFYSPLASSSPVLHYAAVLCFCQHPQRLIPQAEVVFTAGNPGEPRPFVRQEIRGPLPRQIDDALRLVTSRLEVMTAIDSGSKRREELEIPEDIIREIIANAIGHRDYSLNATIQIRLTNDSLEVQSPGAFPAGFSWEDLLSKNIGSNPTDPVVAYYLVRLRNMERIGRGFERIRDYRKANGESSIAFETLPGPAVLVRVVRRRQADSTSRRFIMADNNVLFMECLKVFLEKQTGWQVVGTASGSSQAINLADVLSPDMILIELSMPDSMQAISEIRKLSPGTKILPLTVVHKEAALLAALKAGADGYFHKGEGVSDLLFAIKGIFSNRTYVSSGVSEKVIESYLDGRKNIESSVSGEALTQRQREILKMVAEGYRNSDIAHHLGIGEKTVEKHRQNLMKKLNLSSLSSLVAFAKAKGLIGINK